MPRLAPTDTFDEKTIQNAIKAEQEDNLQVEQIKTAIQQRGNEEAMASTMKDVHRDLKELVINKSSQINVIEDGTLAMLEPQHFHVMAIRSKTRDMSLATALPVHQDRDIPTCLLKRATKAYTDNMVIMADNIMEDAPPGYKRYFNANRDFLRIARNGLLLHGRAPTCLIVLPPVYWWEVIRDAHSRTNHGGLSKTIQEIRQQYDWPAMKHEVSVYINQCPNCQEAKNPKVKERHPLKSPVAKRRNHTIQIDHLTLSETRSGNKGVLVIIDNFS